MIMPARLSDLLSVLSRIMPPLVRALKSNPELVTLALRTLEYWVDRYPCTHMQPVRDTMALACTMVQLSDSDNWLNR